MRTLSSLLDDSASRFQKHSAVEDPKRGCALTYAELASLAREISSALEHAGVRPGDRVGVYAPKSCGTVAALFGILGADAAYVPVDYTAPPARNAYILDDCRVSAVVIERALGGDLASSTVGACTVVAAPGDPSLLGVDLVVVGVSRDPEPATNRESADDLAYILYTSGSTGQPKGVKHTHSSALSFVDWCSNVYDPVPADRFSSHASFHFDLSILDLYVPLKHGATVVLVDEETGKNPRALAPLIADQRISAWYSTPSILRLLVEHGELERYDYSALRIVNFAGEVFPVKHLRAIKRLWPSPRFFNLYGPTETNVCTFYEIPGSIDADRAEPYPIGRACSGDRLMVADPTDRVVDPGTPGELYVSGGSVMAGYWNMPDRNAEAFFVDDADQHWYRTGDVVVDDGSGCLSFVGRRDRMVKRRGYRIELGEIEAALYRHSNVSEAAVVASPDEENGVRIDAYVSTSDGSPIGLIAMKRFCSEALPLYMIPDRFEYRDALPKTSTDKIDYQTLTESA